MIMTLQSLDHEETTQCNANSLKFVSTTYSTLYLS